MLIASTELGNLCNFCSQLKQYCYKHGLLHLPIFHSSFVLDGSSISTQLLVMLNKRYIQKHHSSHECPELSVNDDLDHTLPAMPCSEKQIYTQKRNTLFLLTDLLMLLLFSFTFQIFQSP